MINRDDPPRVLMVVNAEWAFYSHRLALAKALQRAGCEVVVAASVERDQRPAIEAEGLRFIPLHFKRRSINLLSEFASVRELYHLYRIEKPDLVHHVAIKPVLYGSIAAKAAGVPAVIDAITGLGFTFINSGLKGALIRQAVSVAYRLALLGNNVRAIFQNPDDLGLFVSRRIIWREKTVLIRGMGVNIHKFSPTPEPPGTPIIVLASRLLWDKGIGELVEASRILKSRGLSFRLVLVGIPDPENPKSIPKPVIRGWQDEGVIEWWGLRNDMPEVLKQSSIAVLPSYREGVPRFLLEAAASGRPLITTDVPGCREVVRPGENGLLVPVKNVDGLVDAIAALLCAPALRSQMGIRSREIAVQEFSEEKAVDETMAVYQELLGSKWPVPT